MMKDLRSTRIALVVLLVAATLVAISAVVDRDWTLLVWVIIAAANTGLLYSYIRLTEEQAEVIREQGDLIERWIELSPKIIQAVQGETDDD
jgi:hypothetical protein